MQCSPSCFATERDAKTRQDNFTLRITWDVNANPVGDRCANRRIAVNRTAKTTAALMTIAAAALLLVPVQCLAYSYYKTNNGQSVRWNKPTVTVTLDNSLALLGDIDTVENTITVAFDEWVDSASLPVEFVFERADCSPDGYHQGEGNTNCIAASEEFFETDHDAGATTRVSYVNETGAMRDADIVIRSGEWEWAYDAVEGDHSLEAVVLHEVGHFLGMSHSEIEQAIMAPTLKEGECSSPHGLHSDDLDGVSNLYEDFEVPVQMMCSATSVGMTGGGAPIWLGLMAAIGFLVIRRVKEGTR